MIQTTKSNKNTLTETKGVNVSTDYQEFSPPYTSILSSYVRDNPIKSCEVSGNDVDQA